MSYDSWEHQETPDDEDGWEWGWGWRIRDEYDHAAARAMVPDELDDRATWEREPPEGAPPEDGALCRLCGRAGGLDPFNECLWCRVAAGWCASCSIERIEYAESQLGRTCYQWLRRNSGKFTDDELEERRRRVIARRWARRGL